MTACPHCLPQQVSRLLTELPGLWLHSDARPEKGSHFCFAGALCASFMDVVVKPPDQNNSGEERVCLDANFRFHSIVLETAERMSVSLLVGLLLN